MLPKMAGTAALLLSLAATPSLADSQSSNSSSNCSNGHCTRMDSFTEQRGRYQRGWTHWHEWHARPSRRDNDDDD
jgi:hypothetical protein